LKGACADNKDQIRVEKFRIKTGKTAYTSIPKWLADELNSIKRDSEYYFWSGKGDPETRATTFRERMKKIFVAAEVRVYERTAVRRSGGKLKKKSERFKDSHADPHMWRHTLVRDLYTMDRPVREIADILGDDPAIVTRFYSQFDELRRKKVANTMRSLHAQHSILGAGTRPASSD
jgi:integrase